MNWNQIEGQWLQFKGAVKSKWAKLTDDDVDNVAGKRDQLVGRLQERYGILQEDAEKQIDSWIATFDADSSNDDRAARERATNPRP